MSYLKLLHVLFIFIWIGSLLALTRLMAYQVKEPPEIQLRLGRIYKRMYFLVDLPSMVFAIVLGIILLLVKGVDWKAGWLHMKLLFAFLLIVCDLITGAQAVKLSRKAIVGRGIGYKVLHGMTALFLIAVLISIYILKQNGS